MEKRFYRSRNDKKLAGVCAGIAAYFEIDPTLVRLIWIVFTFAGGAGILAYIIAAIIMPEEPVELAENWQRSYQPNFSSAEVTDVHDDEERTAGDDHQQSSDHQWKIQPDVHVQKPGSRRSDDRERNNLTVGIVLILIGVMFFSRNFFRWHWIDFSYLWPAVLILIGVVMIVNKKK